MGTATLAVSQTVSQSALLQSADKRQTERLPCRPKRAGRGNVLSAGKTTCRKGGFNGSTQSGKPNAVGAADEQHPQSRRRNYLAAAIQMKGDALCGLSV